MRNVELNFEKNSKVYVINYHYVPVSHNMKVELGKPTWVNYYFRSQNHEKLIIQIVFMWRFGSYTTFNLSPPIDPMGQGNHNVRTTSIN